MMYMNYVILWGRDLERADYFGTREQVEEFVKTVVLRQADDESDDGRLPGWVDDVTIAEIVADVWETPFSLGRRTVRWLDGKTVKTGG